MRFEDVSGLKKLPTEWVYKLVCGGKVKFDSKPIFKNIEGKRPMLPRNLQINPNKLVSLLNIRATIEIDDDNN